MQPRVNTDEDVEKAEEQFPDETAGAAGVPRKYQVSGAAEHEQPCNHDQDCDAGCGWNDNGQNADEKHQDAECDGPAD